MEKIVHRLSRHKASSPRSRISFAKAKGPLPWPTRGTLIKRFGSKIANSDLAWNGSLIRAPNGQKIRAIFPGKVVFSDWLRGFGLLIIIDHGGGYMTLYGRNQALYKQVDDQVLPNEAIAEVGHSGGYQESSLYFEVRHDSHPENPEKWCITTKKA